MGGKPGKSHWHIIAKSIRNTLCAVSCNIVYCTIHKFICMSVGALSKWLRKALPISENPKLACLEFQYLGIISKLACLEFRYFSIISKLALLEFRYFDIILRLAWLEFQYFGIQKITENKISISVYRYSNIDIPNPVYNDCCMKMLHSVTAFTR